MGSPPQDLSPAEWRLMKVVWALGKPTVRQVHEAVADETAWARPTVKTMLLRMEQKGLIKVAPGEGDKRYTAARTRRSLVSKAVERYLDLVLDGSLAPLVGYLAKSRGLSAEDVRELERILAEDGDDR